MSARVEPWTRMLVVILLVQLPWNNSGIGQEGPLYSIWFNILLLNQEYPGLTWWILWPMMPWRIASPDYPRILVLILQVNRVLALREEGYWIQIYITNVLLWILIYIQYNENKKIKYPDNIDSATITYPITCYSVGKWICCHPPPQLMIKRL